MKLFTLTSKVAKNIIQMLRREIFSNIAYNIQNPLKAH